MPDTWTYTLICDGDCGAEIQTTSRNEVDTTMAVAEALGWTTRDVPSKKKTPEVEVYCDFCQERAKRIVHGR